MVTLAQPEDETPGKKTPTVAEQKARAAYLATLSCPRCGAAGRLYEAQPEYKTGDAPAAFPELHDRAALLGCHACPWTGSEGDLRSDTEIGRIEELMKKKRAPGSGGGSNNGKSRKRPVKRGQVQAYRGDDQAPLGAPDRATRVTVVETKSEVLRLRLTAGDKARTEALADAHSKTLSDLVLFGLLLVDALTPTQWRAWEREAEARRLHPERLVGEACEGWWLRHVADVPFLPGLPGAALASQEGRAARDATEITSTQARGAVPGSPPPCR